MNVMEQRAVFEDAAASHELPHPTPIHSSAFRAHSQNRLGFHGEVERLLGNTVIHAMHAVPIVENRRLAAFLVNQDTMNSAIQLDGKVGIILGEMNNVLEAVSLE